MKETTSKFNLSNKRTWWQPTYISLKEDCVCNTTLATGAGEYIWVYGFSNDTTLSNSLCYYILYAAAAKSLQSYPTLCDPIDSSPPGSPVPGILQARILEWVAIFLPQCMKVKSESEVAQSCPTPWTAAYQAPPSMGFPGKSTGVGCHCLLCKHWIVHTLKNITALNSISVS